MSQEHKDHKEKRKASSQEISSSPDEKGKKAKHEEHKEKEHKEKEHKEKEHKEKEHKEKEHKEKEHKEKEHKEKEHKEKEHKEKEHKEKEHKEKEHKEKEQKVEQKRPYTLNFNAAVDKVHENKSFHEISKLDPSALQGLAERADKMLEKFHIHTIEDLANWKFFHIARSFEVLASVEEDGKRHKDSHSNSNFALDKEWETKSFKEILEAPVSALQGLAEWADGTLKQLHVHSIKDLAHWKYCLWSEAIVCLAKYEALDDSS